MINWNTITLGQYSRMSVLMDIVQSGQKEALEFDLIIGIYSALTGKSREEILLMPGREFTEAANEIYKLFEHPPKPSPARFEYKINEKIYQLTPSPDKMNAGQLIDYLNTIETEPQNYARVLSRLLVLKNGKYGDLPPAEVEKDLMNHFLIEDAIGVCFFFLKLHRVYLNATLRYLKKKLRKARTKEQSSRIREEIDRFTKSTHGISPLPGSGNI